MVMRKMISSTNMTSTSGVVLMADISVFVVVALVGAETSPWFSRPR